FESLSQLGTQLKNSSAVGQCELVERCLEDAIAVQSVDDGRIKSRELGQILPVPLQILIITLAENRADLSLVAELERDPGGKISQPVRATLKDLTDHGHTPYK